MCKKSSKAGRPKKDKIFWDVLDAAIRLEVEHGHLNWRMTDLSRASGISRPLIYYYFGKSREKILRDAIKIVGDDLFALDVRHPSLWQKGLFVESLEPKLRILGHSPHLMAYFVLQRRAKAPFEKEVQSIELRYFKRMSKLCPSASQDQIKVAYAVVIGLAVLSDFPESVVNTAAIALAKILRP